MTLVIARKDLATMWASPLPYVVGVLFQVVLGLLFIDQLRGREQALVQPLVPLAGFLLLAAAPVLSMRSFAEESRSGSLDVLLAVPVPTGALVIGKWLAAWLTALAVLLPSLAHVGLLALYGDPDRGPLIAGYLGLALLAAVLAAVGTLASALTSSQPVAAMIAFFVTLLLWFSHVGTQDVSVGGALAQLSLSERIRSFAGGAIDTGDLGFLVAACGVALVCGVAAVDIRRLR